MSNENEFQKTLIFGHSKSAEGYRSTIDTSYLDEVDDFNQIKRMAEEARMRLLAELD